MAADNRNGKKVQFQKRKPVKNPDPMYNSFTMGKEGIRLIRNMAHGKFNLYNEGHVFKNKDFIRATLNEIEKRIIDASIHVTAISYTYPGTQDPNILNLLHRDQKTYEAYNIAKSTLNSILINDDIGFLWVLINKLPAYRHNI